MLRMGDEFTLTGTGCVKDCPLWRAGSVNLRMHVYVHVPFCARRCSYCDFSIAVRRVVPSDDYVTAVGEELSLRFRDVGTWSVDTLYFGGGTPSRLGGDGVRRLLEVIRRRIDLAP